MQACWAAGLDPMVGFLHLPAHGRASLACDLMEPWRSLVEDWVWAQFRDRGLRAEHCGRDGGGACLMGKAGRQHFYQAFVPVQARCAAGLRRHARLLARVLAGLAGLPAEDEDDGSADVGAGDEAGSPGSAAGAAP